MKMMHGRLRFGLLKHVADAGGADADEHFDEVGAGEAEERHARFAGDRLGQQRLAGARRADEQHALGNPPAQLLILVGRLKEIDDFANFFDRLVDARDVVERDAQIFLGIQPAAAAAKRHRRARADQPAEHEIDEKDRHEAKHNPRRLLIERRWTAGKAEIDVAVAQLLDDFVAILAGRIDIACGTSLFRGMFFRTTSLFALRRELAHIHIAGDRAIVNDDVAQVRIAILLVLLADIDVAGRAFLELVRLSRHDWLAATSRLKSSVPSSRLKNGVM